MLRFSPSEIKADERIFFSSFAKSGTNSEEGRGGRRRDRVERSVPSRERSEEREREPRRKSGRGKTPFYGKGEAAALLLYSVEHALLPEAGSSERRL